MMNQEDLFKKIGHILSELQEQYQYIAEHPQKLNELEVELMLSNANFLTDHIQIVRKTLHHQELKAIPQQAETIKIQELEEASFQFVVSQEPVHDKFEFEEKQVDQIFDRPLTPEEQEIILKKQQLKDSIQNVQIEPVAEDQTPEPVLITTPEPEPTPIIPMIEEVPVVIEEIPVVEELVLEIPAAPVLESPSPEKAVKPSLNELLASSMQANSKADHPVQEIKDLKQAISLNDKLIYVKDLFHGYNLAYAEVIDLLNKMPDFKSAYTFLQHNYAEKNDWNSKEETVERFYQLLKRRFPLK